MPLPPSTCLHYGKPVQLFVRSPDGVEAVGRGTPVFDGPWSDAPISHIHCFAHHRWLRGREVVHIVDDLGRDYGPMRLYDYLSDHHGYHRLVPAS